MFSNIENLKIISVISRQNKPYVKIENRKTHSFFIRREGRMIYDIGDKKIISEKGQIVFMPKGSSYTARTLGGDAMYTAIHFECDNAGLFYPVCYSLEHFYDAEYIASCMSDLWNFGTDADRYQCFSLFYKLLSYLCAIDNTASFEKDKFKIIESAVNYLTEHIYDASLSVERLHRLCGISNTYFRKIFILRFGMTPQKYIISKRMSHAREIITSGDFNTISEVALSVGFSDPLYFSKVFKKVYSISPSDIR